MKQFEDIYKGKRVLITGHTGFKGSWLSLWLEDLGALVSGVALPTKEQPNQDERHGKYEVERPNWSLWGSPDSIGGLGGYNDQGQAPHWYNLLRQMKRGADRRMLRKYKEENPEGTKYGGPMTDEQYKQYIINTGLRGRAPKIGDVIKY